MRTYATYLLIALLLPCAAAAQHLRLSSAQSDGALYLNTNRIFNFDHYNGARFEGEFYYVYPSYHKNENLGRPQWQATVYGGYGLRSSIATYGASAALQIHDAGHWRASLAYDHQLEPCGRIEANEYSMFRTARNSGYVADRFSETHKATLSATTRMSSDVSATVSASHSIERMLFATDGTLLYGDEKRENSWRRYTELRMQTKWRQRLTVDLGAGVAGADERHAGNQTYARLTMRYDRDSKVGKSWTMQLFAQAGAATAHTPLNRVYDISGTYDRHYYFHNTFTTIAPNEFHAHLFAKAFVRIETAMPLWEMKYSSPKPFAQVGMMAGWLCDGGQPTAHLAVEGMDMHAPTSGLLEPSIGIERIVRWGLLDIGAAAGYRITPPHAFYHRNEPRQNLSLMFTANINV